eukprot:scaffold280451_cov23-Tisochrysis_lutea.AAC.1
MHVSSAFQVRLVQGRVLHATEVLFIRTPSKLVAFPGMVHETRRPGNALTCRIGRAAMRTG